MIKLLQKHIMLLAICAPVFMLLLFSCQEKKLVVDENAPLDFSWYIDYDWFTPPNQWGVDPVSAWIKENKRVDISWMSPSGASGDRLNLLVATGDIPDVVCLADGPRVTKLIESGLLLNFDSYLDEMPNLKRWAGLNLDLLRYKDGKLYQFPNWYINPNATSGNGGNAWGINTIIYKALGSPPLKTFDDMEAYLTKVKAAYPDVIPLETGDGFQAGQLVYRGMGEHLWDYMSRHLGKIENEKFTKVFDDAYARQTMVYFNRLMRNKLITQDAFTETHDQMVEKLIGGKAAVFVSYDFANLVESVNSNNKISKDLYDVIWPPVGPGVDPSKASVSGFATIGWNVNVFSKAAEPKIRQILHYLDWATGPDGQRILCYGPPGYFWDKTDTDGIPFWNEKYEKSTDKQRTDSQIFRWNWVGNVSWVDIGKVAANNRLPPQSQSPTVRMQGTVIWKTSMNENEWTYSPPDPASDLGIIDTQCADIFDEAKAKTIMAPTEAQAIRIMDEAQKEMDALGYQQILDFHTVEWQKRKELLVSLMKKQGVPESSTK